MTEWYREYSSLDCEDTEQGQIYDVGRGSNHWDLNSLVNWLVGVYIAGIVSGAFLPTGIVIFQSSSHYDFTSLLLLGATGGTCAALISVASTTLVFNQEWLSTNSDAHSVVFVVLLAPLNTSIIPVLAWFSPTIVGVPAVLALSFLAGTVACAIVLFVAAYLTLYQTHLFHWSGSVDTQSNASNTVLGFSSAIILSISAFGSSVFPEGACRWVFLAVVPLGLLTTVSWMLNSERACHCGDAERGSLQLHWRLAGYCALISVSWVAVFYILKACASFAMPIFSL